MIEATRTRLRRGWILWFLANQKVKPDGTQSPTGVDHLQRLLGPAQMESTPEEILRELAYLKGKGYVEVERYSAEYARMLPLGALSAGARITSTGRDVAEGTVQDPGVDMGGKAD